ncbi:MAG: 50S ribosomal protein L17 [Chloroflexi bacterium]|nr:50S ribosomal protein L17 [Chloroflexota bacterium]
MRHRRSGRKFGRASAPRKAMYRIMVTDLLRHEVIRTTHAKSKEVAPLAEKMVTHAKRGDLHNRRQAAAFITDKVVLSKTFDELADRYRERDGGYTRVIKLGKRAGDGAEMALIELVE